jgi:nitroreductase
MDDAIRKAIMRAAVYSPSGENCQPWRFEVQADRIRIFNLPDRDRSLYNFRQLGSYVAHGALAENLVLTLTEAGYSAEVEPFPDAGNPELTAQIRFTKTQPKRDPLVDVMGDRATNRKPYLQAPFAGSERSAIEACTFGRAASVVFLEDKIKREAVAKAMTVGDRLLFENRAIHDFLFSHINWTLRKERKERRGFYIKTLELPLPVELVFRLVRYWGVLRILNAIGFSKMAAQGNTSLYLASSAFGAVVANGNGPADFFEGGRVMQRVWLTATSLGLSIQPVTAPLFFIQRILAGEPGFTKPQEDLVRDAFGTISNAFGLGDRTMTMLFRIGCAPTRPTAVSLKAEPDVQELPGQ